MLHLLPNRDKHTVLKCHLREASLDVSITFEAISYTWGSSNNRVGIDWDEESVPGTRNCDQVLRRLRLPNAPRILWIDALCINQLDIDERNQQVQIMGQIYQTAERVLIWLGPATADSDIALDFLSSFEPIVGKRGEERGRLIHEKFSQYISTYHVENPKFGHISQRTEHLKHCPTD